MKSKIIILALAALTASASLAEAHYRGGGDRGFRHRRVIIEQQPAALGLGLGALLLLGQMGQQKQYVAEEPVYEQPAPRLRRALPSEPKLRDNPIPMK